MLLRVPAASLRDLATFGQKMQALGYPYYAIGTRIAFDPAEAYPKFVLSAIRPLTDAEADLVLEMREARQITTILAEGSENAGSPGPTQQAAQIASAFEQPPITPVPAPQIVQPQPVQQAVQAAPQPAQLQPTPVQQVEQSAPQPVKVPSFGGAGPKSAAQVSNFETELDAQLDQLLGS